MNTDKFYRGTFFPSEYVFGLDSVQGYLEFANSELRNKSMLVFPIDEENDFSSAYFKLKQLEREGHIEAKWEEATNSSGESHYKIKQMALTTSGHKLLDELRVKSRRGKLLMRLSNLFWIVLTSMVTTLVVLKLKGI